MAGGSVGGKDINFGSFKRNLPAGKGWSENLADDFRQLSVQDDRQRALSPAARELESLPPGTGRNRNHLPLLSLQTAGN